MMKIGGMLAILASLALSACTSSGQVGELQQTTRNVDLGGAKTVQALIQMGAGDLTITGDGASPLLAASFDYNIPVWKPEVNYTVSGDVGQLEVQQPAGIELNTNLANYQYQWVLRFNDQVPLDMNVRLGAGISSLMLGGMSVERLDVQTGAGEATLDLTGNWQNNLAATITGGVGNLTIKLPKDTGARVTVSGGLGDIIANGVKQDGDGFVNDAYGSSDHTLLIDVKGGMGKVNLQVGPY
jgi:hypothetical protein